MRDWECSQAKWREWRAHARAAVTLHEVAREKEESETNAHKRTHRGLKACARRSTQKGEGAHRPSACVKAGREGRARAA
eukprot:1237357-Pleurochrysis_carterae.AAC.1